MKTTADSKSNVLEKQVRNSRYSKKLLQYAFLDNRAIEGSPEEEINITTLEVEENLVKLKKTKLCIKNMVSLRCIMAVKGVLENLGLNYVNLELGEVEIIGNLSDVKLEVLKTELLKFELELIEDKEVTIVKKLIKVIDDMIHDTEEQPHIKLSVYFSEKMNYGYAYLSHLFLKFKGTSVQQFIISRRIEWVKEMLLNDDMSLTDIAWKLHYSSVAHLSIQFKKITGVSPTRFKQFNYRNNG